jgi:hypothetical protein
MWWPGWLARRRTEKWRKQVRRIRKKAENRADPLYNEYWYTLRQFPVDKHGNPTATAPTRIGNILASYEDYPEQRYGMDSVFYWPRIWLALDKDVREEINSAWAPVDFLLYTAAGAAALGVVYLVLALISYVLSWHHFAWPFTPLTKLSARFSSWPFTDPTQRYGAIAGGLGLLLTGYICLRLSISGHLTNGENFKSLFDLYRPRVAAVTGVPVTVRARWHQTWQDLQYWHPPASRSHSLTRLFLALTVTFIAYRRAFRRRRT